MSPELYEIALSLAVGSSGDSFMCGLHQPNRKSITSLTSSSSVSRSSCATVDGLAPSIQEFLCVSGLQRGD